jgi:N-acetylglucosamine-6-phosphate deacetylase
LSVDKKLVHSANAFIKGQFIPDSWILFSDQIEKVGVGSTWTEHVGDARIIDAENRTLTPGLIDTHVHGGGGFSAEEGTDGIQGLIDFHKSQGTTSLIVSFVSNPLEKLEELLKQAVAVAKREPSLIGIHLEGPFLSHSHKGAHNPSALQIPTVASLERLIHSGGGLVKSMTIAPELFSEECLAVLSEAGVKICIGHTDADFDQTAEAFENYASVLTHAFNGMNPIHHRAPGPVVAAIESENAWIELIADGVHVNQNVAKLLPSKKLILVTDAMEAAGRPDGEYKLGEMSVVVKDAVAKTESGSIAGSTLTLARAVSNYGNWVGSIETGLAAATLHPALAYGLHNLGSIDIGMKASLVLWADPLNPQTIW